MGLRLEPWSESTSIQSCVADMLEKVYFRLRAMEIRLPLFQRVYISAERINPTSENQATVSGSQHVSQQRLPIM